jgi:serine/threonine protein kinase
VSLQVEAFRQRYIHGVGQVDLSTITPDDSAEPPDLTHNVRISKANSSAYGGFADVFEGTLNDIKVAIKALRVTSKDIPDGKHLVQVGASQMSWIRETYYSLQQFHREMRIWQGLSHKNILPLFGVVAYREPFKSPVSPWIQNGTLTAFLNHEMSLDLPGRFKIV